MGKMDQQNPCDIDLKGRKRYSWGGKGMEGRGGPTKTKYVWKCCNDIHHFMCYKIQINTKC